MKKTIALICTFILIILPSCSKSFFSPPPERQTHFTSDVKITFGEKTFSGKLECASPCSLRLTLTEPDEIKGFSVLYNGNEYVCDVLGIEDKISTATVSDSSFIKLFFEGVNSALFDEAKLSPNANNDFNAQLQGNKFKAVYDCEGRIKLLYSEAFSLSANFFSTDL